MSVPSVSVVIPTYNRCAEVTDAVRSALEQDPPPLEVLVCDDGSTDGTREAFERWQREDARVRYLRLEQNRGRPAPARNLGIAEAAGDWVAFLDSDDRWLPGKLARQMPHLAAGRHDVVAGDALRFGGDRYFGVDRIVLEPVREDVLRQNPLILSTAVVRRSLLDRTGGFEQAAWAAGVEDYALWLDASTLGARILALPDPVAVYCDVGEDRLSAAAVQRQRGVMRLFWQRWICRPRDGRLFVAALHQTHNAWLVWRGTCVVLR